MRDSDQSQLLQDFGFDELNGTESQDTGSSHDALSSAINASGIFEETSADFSENTLAKALDYLDKTDDFMDLLNRVDSAEISLPRNVNILEIGSNNSKSGIDANNPVDATEKKDNLTRVNVGDQVLRNLVVPVKAIPPNFPGSAAQENVNATEKQDQVLGNLVVPVRATPPNFPGSAAQENIKVHNAVFLQQLNQPQPKKRTRKARTIVHFMNPFEMFDQENKNKPIPYGREKDGKFVDNSFLLPVTQCEATVQNVFESQSGRFLK